MKRIGFICFEILLTGYCALSAQTVLKEKLEEMPAVEQVKPLEAVDFAEKYVAYFVQPLDHAHPERGTFVQRVFVFHEGFDRPTVIVTEGYGAAYAEAPKYREELSRLYKANLIVVEHRYFLESAPRPKDWRYLTAKNSADDLHAVRTAFNAIYPGKWIATGISKGGQTALLYHAFYPDDVDISVPYVTPLNYSVEDGRHEPFIRSVSTADDRRKVQDFQLEILKRRTRLQPLFDQYCEDRRLTFPVPLNEVYDYCVLEYSFAVWQWGIPMDEIPSSNTPDQVMFDHWMKQCDPTNFDREGYFKPFFVQAARELGYYGYDTRPFEKYLTLKSAEGWVNRLMLPDELKGITFDKTLCDKVTDFLKRADPKMIFLYGGSDPWSASGVCQWLNTEDKKNLHVFVQQGGSHKTRIGTMPEEQQREIRALIRQWLDE